MDIQALLTEISPDAPCGEDVSYDPQMLELEKLASGKQDTQFAQGEGPDWRRVHDLSLELLGRSKHLRVAVLLTLAAMRQEGAPGLRDGLRLIAGMVEQFWDRMWPALDPDDDNDPTERVNMIAAISPPKDSFADPLKFKQYVIDIPLAMSRQLGTFTVRDGMKATGEMPVKDPATEKVPTLSTISSAFQDTPPAQQEAIRTAFREAKEEVDRLDGLLNDKSGGRGVNFETLAHILKCANSYMEKIGGSTEAAEAAPAEAPGDAPASAGGAPAASAVSAPGEIRSTADVQKTLDRLCDYYARNEPSSPVPVLLKRAKRLVGKSFEDLLKDLTPGGLRQLQVFSGEAEGGEE